MAIITGTNDNDQYPRELEGTNLADQIYGLLGHDVLIGFGGNDTLEGGAGADQLFGSDGFDVTSYRGSATGVQVVLYGGYGSFGDAAGDQLYGVEGVIGSAFADGLAGDDLRNELRGGSGNDELSGYGGNDALYGDGGNDSVDGYEGNDKLNGGTGNDILNGGAGNDELLGGDGRDTADFFYSEKMFSGAEIASAGVVADLVAGTATGGDLVGSDHLVGIENLGGTLYNDRLLGNSGANRLTGESGADVLTGRGGADRFVYEAKYESTPVAADRILDFSRAQGDKIDLSGVDANEGGELTFQFIGQGAFTAIGQVRWFQQNGDTIIEANTDNTLSSVEMRIEIDPLVSLQATDFVL